MRMVFVFVSVTLVATPASARPYQCRGYGFGDRIERPSAPSCVTLPFQGNETSFSLCKSEMETYQISMQGYLDCLRAESKEAADEYNSTVNSFNCNARGSYC